jgi:hypothetical protein
MSLSYRPITDTWVLVRSKVQYYGAYAGGFLERARALMGVHIHDPVLHICGGKVKNYPYPERALGTRDATVDLDPACAPDYLMDVRELGATSGLRFPVGAWEGERRIVDVGPATVSEGELWAGAIIDRPYTTDDAEKYVPGASVFPASLNELLKNALTLVRPGGRVGVLDYIVPQPPKVGVKFVALVGVVTGFNNRIRAFTVYERVWSPTGVPQDGGDELGDELTVEDAERKNAAIEQRLSAPMDDALAKARAAAKVPHVCRDCWRTAELPDPGPEIRPVKVKCAVCGKKTECVPAASCVGCEQPIVPQAGAKVAKGPMHGACVPVTSEDPGENAAMDGF